MQLDLLQYGLGTLSGMLVGLTLGLFGGGGSILATPLMVYLVGVPSVHVALGTSALAVAANAATNLLTHARMGNVNWRCASIFSVAGVAGAFFGSSLGKILDGDKLLFLFALVMIAVGVLMLRARHHSGEPTAQCTIENAPRTIGLGLLTGGFSGFFGIGGGFLIVPGLIAATHMSMLAAIGSSLLAVTAFGLTTATNYAISGFVDWPLALAFVAGGAVGGIAGAHSARRLASARGVLNVLFAALIFAVAAYMLWRNAAAFGLS